MHDTRQRRLLLGLFAGVAVLVAALLVWSPVVGRDATVPLSSAALPEDAPLPKAALESAMAPEVQPRAALHADDAASPAAAVPRSTPKAEPAARAPELGVTLLAEFTRPDHVSIEVESASVELRDAAGAVRTASVQRSRTVQIEGLAPAVYSARVDAVGFEHREQTLDLRQADDAGHGPRRERGLRKKRLTLWPADWVAVIVETPEGRLFAELATDLGHSPMGLFVGAFQVRARLEAPGAREDPQANEVTLARFRPPPEYKSWELSKSCVGSLQLLHPAPLWIGLDLFGKPVGWELLPAGQREVVFRIDMAMLEERFARVALRTVDARDKSPVAGVLVTLRADTSAHRRPDLTDVPTRDDGRVELAHIVPGRYELNVARGESQHQRMLDLAPGERRNLGDIALSDSIGVDVIVLDEREQPAKAYLEVGPYTRGARSGEMYPASIRHHADSNGKGRVPMPSDPAIVRATIEPGRSNGDGSVQEVRGVRSANVMLDPRKPPSAPLKLKLRAPVAVHLASKLPEVQRIEIWDELDCVVARTVPGKGGVLDAELVPGNYRARTVAADGTAGFETPFNVDREPLRIDID